MAKHREPKIHRQARSRAMTIDYTKSATMPIRDMHRDGAIVFLVTVYGWTGRECCIVPDGSEPFVKAVERLGLDPNRYQAWLWDAPI